MLFTPLLLAFAALVSADDSALLEFTPPLLTMDTASATFKVRMLKPPSNNIATTVYLKQPGFQFSNCQLTFDIKNFDVGQEIEIMAAPSFSADNKKAKIEAVICAPDTPYTNLKDEYTVAPKQYPGKTCKSTGGMLLLTLTLRSSCATILRPRIRLHGTRFLLLVQERSARDDRPSKYH
jgi:hypothetical protein